MREAEGNEKQSNYEAEFIKSLRELIDAPAENK